MIRLTKKEQAFLKQIADVHGAILSFHSGSGGWWKNKTIELGIVGDSKSKIISTFCHELAHYINSQTGVYPAYHSPSFEFTFKNYDRQVRYALNAELKTDKVAKTICKEWFPGVKFVGNYSNNMHNYWFLYGYFYSERV